MTGREKKRAARQKHRAQVERKKWKLYKRAVEALGRGSDDAQALFKAATTQMSISMKGYEVTEELADVLKANPTLMEQLLGFPTK